MSRTPRQPLARVAGLLLLALLVAACGDASGGDASGGDASGGDSSGAADTSPETSPAARPPGAGELARADPDRPERITTPGEDVPNPFVLVEQDRYVLYASQIGIFDPTIQVRTSDTLDRWGPPTDAMPQVPAWVAAGFTWAPDVRRVGDTYVMWFTARVKAVADPPTQCIGVAFSDEALGPFVGDPEPLVCQLDRRGSIDPRSFAAEDGSLWLHWKSDDNADVEGTTTSSIYAQRLSDDARRLTGEAVRILEVDQPWEGRIVEAPHMLRRPDGRHWLWYSANWFNQPAYGIGVAECDGPAGPCRKPFDGPWLATNAQGEGPGESSHVVDREGRVWILYSPLAQQFETTTKRPVAMAQVGFDERGPYPAAPIEAPG